MTLASSESYSAGTASPALVAAVEPRGGSGEGGQLAGGGEEDGPGVLGVEAELDGVAAEADVFLAEGKGIAGGDGQLQRDEVEARHGFRDGVLDLQAGVHFEEGEGTAAVLRLTHEKLDGAGVHVAGVLHEAQGGGCELFAEDVVDGGTGGLFDELLVAALDGAVAFAEVDCVAVAIGEDLHLDMAGVPDVALEEEAVVAEGSGGLAAGGFDGRGEVRGGLDEPHAEAATAATGLEHEGEADLAGGGEVIGGGAFGAGEDGDAAGGGEVAGRHLVAQQGEGLGGGADEDEAGLRAGAGEVGALAEQPVAGMDGLAALIAGGGDDGGDVEVGFGSGAAFEQYDVVREAGGSAVAVGHGGDEHGADAEFSQRADDAHRDLAAVGHQHGCEHGGIVGGGGDGPRRERPIGG